MREPAAIVEDLERGQRFAANPLIMWVATDSQATAGGIDVGGIGPAPEQAHLRDVAIRTGGVRQPRPERQASTRAAIAFAAAHRSLPLRAPRS